MRALSRRALWRYGGAAGSTLIAAAGGVLLGSAAYPAAGTAAVAAGAAIAIWALRRSRRREEETRALMAAIVESSEDAIVVTGTDGVITAWNAAAERLYGYTAVEVKGRPVSILYVPGRPDEPPGALERLRRGERVGHFEAERRTRDGRVIQVSVTISPVRCDEGRLIGISRIARDITERKHAEEELARAGAEAESAGEALRETLQRLDFHLANSPLAAVEWDDEFRVVRWSASAERIFGWSAGEVLGRTIASIRFLHEDDAPAIAALMREMVVGGSPRSFKTNRNYRKDGSVLHCEWYSSALLDPAGRLVSVLSLGLDVTERVRVQNALIRSEERFELAQRAGNIGVYEWDLRGGSVVWSEQMEALFGLGPGEFEGRFEAWARRIHRDDLRRMMATVRDALRAQDPEIPTEFRAIRPDGAERWLSGRGRLIYDEHSRPARVVGSVTDITDRRHAEEKLRHTDKLESLANLAGGVAHDFNNLLVGVLGYAGLLMDELPRDSRMREYCEAILAAGERAAQLTRQMLAYSGRGKFVVRHLDLSREIREMASLVHSAIPRNVSLELELAADLPSVEADPGQLQQLFMNLVVNAAEAMPEGGPVTVTTSLREVDRAFLERAVADTNATPGRYVQLEVRDTGHGMDAATRAKIFDPFFTTKFVGRGLGLAAVSGIVRGHGGVIDVISAPGEGATFRALLPVAMGAAGMVLIVANGNEVAPVGEALREQGYEVAAATPRESVQVFEAAAQHITLVLFGFDAADAGMPETVRRLRAIRPDVRIDFLARGCSAADVKVLIDGGTEPLLLSE